MAKDMYAALGIIQFRFPPPSRRQIVEKVLKTRDLVIDPIDLSPAIDAIDFAKKIINLVAKDTAFDAI